MIEGILQTPYVGDVLLKEDEVEEFRCDTRTAEGLRQAAGGHVGYHVTLTFTNVMAVRLQSC